VSATWACVKVRNDDLTGPLLSLAIKIVMHRREHGSTVTGIADRHG
jgi:hypothetical protein